MRRRAASILIGLVLLAGCQETDEMVLVPGDGDGSTLLVAGFDPADPVPDALSVSAAEDAATGPLVTVAVNVTDVDDVFGAGFDLTFDPALIEYLSWTPGDLLEQGGNTPSYQVTAPSPGQLVVGASRTGGAGGADAVGTRTLIRFTFRALGPGDSTLALANGDLLDGQAPPQAIGGLDWSGGTLVAD